VAAAVAAGLGGALDEVAAEARGGLAAKAAHLASPSARAPEESRSGATAPGPTLRLVVANRLGLHARPAALLVRTAAGFDAEVTLADLTAGRGPVSARSLNAVATLGVVHGDEILVRASGPQAAEALAAIRRLADEGFGEPPDDLRGAARAPASATPASSASARPEPEPVAAPAAGSVLHGLPGSPGIAVGATQAAGRGSRRGARRPGAGPRRRLGRPGAGPGRHRRRHPPGARRVAGRACDYDAAIFDAHLLFLDDEALLVRRASRC